ncbi:MAG: pilus assembly protein PilB, partial [Deltaproteobacteria bacterium]
MSKKKLGDILLENNLISEQQLGEALELQKTIPGETVGQLLCKLGFMKESDLNYILEQTGMRKKLVDILIQGSLVTNAQIDQARVLSRKDEIPLEKALLRLGFLREDQLSKVISIQYDLPFVSLENLVINQELANFTNASYA